MMFKEFDMNASTENSGGCGSGACQCSATASSTSASGAVEAPVVARVNGITLVLPGEQLEAEALRERACAELLRQEAVRQKLLPRHPGLDMPELAEPDRKVIEDMVEAAISVESPGEVECRRHYEANLTEFVVGQAMHVRHILFAVTPGVDVHALRVRAEAALMELLRKDVPTERFAQMATELSNCPSGAQGGDLGWVGPDDCAPELSNELFHQKNPLRGMGVHPRLIHTRFGFHVIEVLGRRKGKQIEFEVVQGRIADRLALQLRAKALRDYMQGLAARAELDGVELDPPGSPLIQ